MHACEQKNLEGKLEVELPALQRSGIHWNSMDGEGDVRFLHASLMVKRCSLS